MDQYLPILGMNQRESGDYRTTEERSPAMKYRSRTGKYERVPDHAPAITTPVTVVDETYAWAQCPKCHNTVKFGSRLPVAICAGCGSFWQQPSGATS